MIYTVTFNPALDYFVNVDGFEIGKTNRASGEWMLPGGKGINVSIVLKNLGMESVPLGFVAGFTGCEIEKRLSDFGVHGNFVTVKSGNSRINIKLRSGITEDGDVPGHLEETDIIGQGLVISKEEIDCFYDQLDTVKAGDALVLAGSIPASLSPTIYRDILEKIEKKDVMTVVDATGTLLLNVLEFHPFLIKPNHLELGDLFGVSIDTKEKAVKYAKKLQESGARNVLVSMGGDGAVLLTQQGDVYKAQAPKGVVRNTVGAGDSMVAGFIYGYIRTKSYENAFRYGVCAGSASSFSDLLATGEAINELLPKLDF